MTNGVYQTGGRVASEADAITNRVAVTKALMLRSVNGAAVTLIQGYRDPDRNNPDYFSTRARCVYLANGAALVGLTLTNGLADNGGGVWCESTGAVDGSADITDADGDGMNNWQEWHASTNPTNALSVLRLLSPVSGALGLIVSWQSVSGLNYFLERCTDLRVQPPFLPLATNIVGQPGTTTFTDTNAVGPGPFFYRVGVQE